MTLYFREQVLRKRPYLKVEWCLEVIAHPVRREVQPDKRIRFWVIRWSLAVRLCALLLLKME